VFVSVCSIAARFYLFAPFHLVVCLLNSICLSETCVVLCPLEKVSSLAEQAMVRVPTFGGGGGSRIMKGLDLL